MTALIIFISISFGAVLGILVHCALQELSRQDHCERERFAEWQRHQS